MNTASEYSAVFKHAKRVSDNLLTVLVSKNPDKRAKLGLAIAKKMVKKAVLRNRIKRMVREAFRLRKQQLIGVEMVVLCRQKAGFASKKELSDSINKHFDSITKQ